MKKTLMSALIIAAALVVHADYLYWMVGDEYIKTAESAKLYAVSGDVMPGTAIDTRDSVAIQTAGSWEASSKLGSFETDISNYQGDGWSYYVEIVNAGKTLTTAPITYSQGLGSFIGNIHTPANLANGAFGTGTGLYNVPEPTSGLLFLVGGMLLGLRRKRRV